MGENGRDVHVKGYPDELCSANPICVFTFCHTLKRVTMFATPLVYMVRHRNFLTSNYGNFSRRRVKFERNKILALRVG